MKAHHEKGDPQRNDQGKGRIDQMTLPTRPASRGHQGSNGPGIKRLVKHYDEEGAKTSPSNRLLMLNLTLNTGRQNHAIDQGMKGQPKTRPQPRPGLANPLPFTTVAGVKVAMVMPTTVVRGMDAALLV